MSAKWTKEYDNESGQYYYLNAIDGSSTWEKPADYVEPEGKWTKEWDNNSNAYYYLNGATGESTWDVPKGFTAETSTKAYHNDNMGEDKRHIENHSHLHNENRYKTESQPLILSVWSKVYDPSSGSYYYYNNLSGISQWETPHNFNDRIAKQASKALTSATKKKGALLKLPTHLAKFHASVKIQSSFRQKKLENVSVKKEPP